MLFRSNSDFTEQEIREFEEQWQVPVLRIANVTEKRLADGRSLGGRSGVMVSVNITSNHRGSPLSLKFSNYLIKTKLRRVVLFESRLTLTQD